LNATPAKQPQPQCSRIQQASKGYLIQNEEVQGGIVLHLNHTKGLDTEQGGAVGRFCTVLHPKQSKGRFTSYLLTACCKPKGKIASSISNNTIASVLGMPAMLRLNWIDCLLD